MYARLPQCIMVCYPAIPSDLSPLPFRYTALALIPLLHVEFCLPTPCTLLHILERFPNHSHLVTNVETFAGWKKLRSFRESFHYWQSRCHLSLSYWVVDDRPFLEERSKINVDVASDSWVIYMRIINTWYPVFQAIFRDDPQSICLLKTYWGYWYLVIANLLIRQTRFFPRC